MREGSERNLNATPPGPALAPSDRGPPQTDALEISEARFRTVLDSVPTVAVQGYAPDGTVIYWNKASADVYGYTPEEAIGRNLLDLIIPAHQRQAVQENVLDMVQKGKSIPAGELTLMRKDGSPVHVHSSHACVKRADGQVEMYCFDVDLAERKRIERELQERSQRAAAQRTAIARLATNPSIYEDDFEAVLCEIIKATASTLDVARVGVWLFDKNHTQLRCLHVYDSRQDQLLTEPPVNKDALPNYFEPLLNDTSFMTTDTRTDPQFADIHSEYLASRHIRAMLDAAIIVDGQFLGILCIEETGTPREWQADEESFARSIASLLGQSILNADIKRLSGELQQAQKMDSIGRLAGGIAHDFNNMLNIILGHAELSLEMIVEDDPIREELLGIVEATKRSAELTQQLLAFARRQPITPHPISLTATVENMLPLLQRLIGNHIQLIWTAEQQDDMILADRSQVDQLLVNLCVNARDALNDQAGRIHLRISTTTLNQDDVVWQKDMTHKKYVLLEVEDNGCGMSAETLEHLFEPFYTTKEEGRGTGLGLATVYGIVRQNHGTIRVTSAPGKGSLFQIYLPTIAAAP